MNKLKELLSLCKCGVCIDINNHRDYYQSVDQYFDDMADGDNFKKETDPEVFQITRETNTIIEIQAYPDTPVGFFKVFHYDIEQAIEEMIAAIKNDRASKIDYIGYADLISEYCFLCGDIIRFDCQTCKSLEGNIVCPDCNDTGYIINPCCHHLPKEDDRGSRTKEVIHTWMIMDNYIPHWLK